MVGEVPSGWRDTTIGEVLEIVGGTTPSRGEPDYWGGPIPWASPTDITALPVGQMNVRRTADTISEKGLKESSLSLLPPGTVLMTSRATIGDAVVAEVPITTNQGFCNFLPSSTIAPYFLAYWLRHQTGHLKSLAAGSTFLEINRGVLRKLRIPLPPLPEQQKIATILSSVDEAIQATQAVIDQTRRVKEGLLQDLLTRGLPGHTRFKQTEIGEIPEGWEVATGRELARRGDLVGGPFGSDLGAADYVEVGVPVIRGGNVGLGKFIESDFVYVSPDKARLLRRNSAQRGDLIMTQRGASLGEATLIPDGAMFDSYVISQTMMRLRPNSQVVDPLFLIQSICSDRAQSWLKSRAIGNAQPHLNLSIWQDMPVAIPPKKEQIQIASIVASLDDSMAASGKEVAALTSLKAGLLADLLTGKVRVTT